MIKIFYDPSHPLKQVLKKAGITQVIAAHCLNITHSQLYRYLNGYTTMPRDLEKHLRELLVSIEKEATHENKS